MTDSYQNKLENKIWRTRGARFNAARRVRRNKEFANYAVTFVSAYVLALSVPDVASWAGLDDTPGPLIALAIIVFAASALRVNDDSDVRAYLLHECGKALNPLLEAVQQLNPSSTDAAKDVAREYNAVIASYYVNHESEDDNLFCAYRRKQFDMSWLQGVQARVSSVRLPLLYAALIVLPPVWVILQSSY